MPLWQRVRASGPIDFSEEQAETTRREIVQLLHSSYQLGLQHEVTPVQVLQALRDRALQTFISIATMRVLVTEMRKILRCYGYVSISLLLYALLGRISGTDIRPLTISDWLTRRRFGAVFDRHVVGQLVAQYC